MFFWNRVFLFLPSFSPFFFVLFSVGLLSSCYRVVPGLQNAERTADQSANRNNERYSTQVETHTHTHTISTHPRSATHTFRFQRHFGNPAFPVLFLLLLLCSCSTTTTTGFVRVCVCVRMTPPPHPFAFLFGLIRFSSTAVATSLNAIAICAAADGQTLPPDVAADQSLQPQVPPRPGTKHVSSKSPPPPQKKKNNEKNNRHRYSPLADGRSLICCSCQIKRNKKKICIK